jgi:3-deoxy-7-phosphoheptulonate synthase
VSVAKDGDAKYAAIAGEVAAKIHGLKVLKAGIETNPLNYTRFAVVARRGPASGAEDGEAPTPAGLAAGPPNKASIVFSVPNEPGSLFACLKILSDFGINLSKLESRPIPGKPWRYLFYVDVSIPDAADAFRSALAELKQKTEDFHFLGTYRASL